MIILFKQTSISNHNRKMAELKLSVHYIFANNNQPRKKVIIISINVNKVNDFVSYPVKSLKKEASCIIVAG
jgi:hypothetical protein